jgi:hypothetical protein
MALPVIVTAISNSDQESFIAGTLFSQGWSVIHRAVDFESLVEFCSTHQDQTITALLLYSPELIDFDPAVFESLTLSFRQVIGFVSSIPSGFTDDSLHQIPETATQLATFIRGFARSPLIRKLPSLIRSQKRARIMAISSAGTCTGASTVAINLAHELSIKEK